MAVAPCPALLEGTLAGYAALATLLGCGVACGEAPQPRRAPASPPPLEVDESPASTDAGTCQGLFGRPTPASGLTESQCSPACACSDGPWAAPEYPATFAETLKDWDLVDPYSPIASDPYASNIATPPEGSRVCGVLPLQGAGRRYRLVDYANERDALAASAMVTHTGPCGVCSTLADLSVYIAQPDLTEPVRDCALTSASGPAENHIACLQRLGFTLPCAQIWYYNTLNTRRACASTCIAELGKPYHRPDGSLNACLQCDEDESGAVFQAIAGRTRRNSGLPNALCRPCNEVSRIMHRYE